MIWVIYIVLVTNLPPGKMEHDEFQNDPYYKRPIPVETRPVVSWRNMAMNYLSGFLTRDPTGLVLDYYYDVVVSSRVKIFIRDKVAEWKLKSNWVDATILKVDNVNKMLKIRYDKHGFEGPVPKDEFIHQDQVYPL